MKPKFIAVLLPLLSDGLSAPTTTTTSRPRLAKALLRAEDPAAAAKWYEEHVNAEAHGDDAVFATSAGDFTLAFSDTETIEKYDTTLKPYEHFFNPKKPGFLGVGVELEPEHLTKFCADLAVEAEDREFCASMVPDEDPNKETWITVAEVQDPVGFPVAALTQKDRPPKHAPAPKIVLCVSDLDASIQFYSNALGMRLLRKRALLPDLPAMSAFFAFADDDFDLIDSVEGADHLATPRIELRYLYNNQDKVWPGHGLGDIIIDDVDDPSAIADNVEAFGGSLPEDSKLPDGSIKILDPDGYTFIISP